MHKGDTLLDKGNRWAWSRLAERIRRRDGFRCTLCGSRGRLEVDHVLPRSLGGSDKPSNLRTLCRPCHVARTVGETDRTPPRPRPFPPSGGSIFRAGDEARSGVVRQDYTRRRRLW